MKYFDIDEQGLITPKDERLSYYWFDSNELNRKRDGTGGCHEWFIHLSEKSWFSEYMFWDLLEFAKQKFPEENYDKTVF